MSTNTDTRQPWLRSVLLKFTESRLPTLLACGLAGLSVTLGLVIYSGPRAQLVLSGYGPVFDHLSPDAIGLALILLGFALAVMHLRETALAMLPAGLLAVVYSVLAGSVVLSAGGVAASGGLFILLLFAGYAAGILALTCGIRDD